MKASFTFVDAVQERPIRNRWDLLLGVVATFRILILGEVIYEEHLFPIVELRAQLARWLVSGFPLAEDFEFVSMESDEPGLVWIRAQPSGDWRVGSAQQDKPSPALLVREDVAEAGIDFVKEVDRWVLEHCDVSVESYL